MKTVLKRLQKKLIEESGQAVIEYILVLAVVVGVVLGGLYQFNDAFKKWADSYFGDYLACLLEAGELPALGGGGGGECTQLYKEFSLADGRPHVGEGIGGGGGGSAEGGENQTGEFGNGGDGSAGVYRGGGGSVVVQSVPSADLGGRSQRFRARSSAGAGAGEEDASSSNTGSAAITDLGSYQSGKAVRIPLREVGSIRGGVRAEEEKEEKTKTKVASSSVETESRKGPERIKVERRTASTAAAPEIEEFTFGKLLRYLIIAAIIIAIILFIGGQAIQVSKSM
jgi:type IV secretory pathway TrbL component